MEDWPTWHFDAKGRFSVKSAYKLVVARKDAQTAQDASSSVCAIRSESDQDLATQSLIKLKCLYGVVHITAFLLEGMWPDVGYN